MVDFIAIQNEQIEWSERNFGKQHARYPLLGMVEELLEFDAAWKAREAAAASRAYLARSENPYASLDTKLDESPFQKISDADFEKLTADIVDAIGDIGIYMLDYYGKRHMQLNDIWLSRNFLDEHTRRNWFDLTPLARRLAHHQLKGEQGIRGTPESHNQEIDVTCRAILAHLEFICSYLHLTFPMILNSVWVKVRLRDWTKNKANAHEVAEQQLLNLDNVARSTDP